MCSSIEKWMVKKRIKFCGAVLYLLGPLLFIFLFSLGNASDFNIFTALMFGLCIYSLPAGIVSVISLIVKFLCSNCIAVYTFLTLNLLLLSVVTSILFN